VDTVLGASDIPTCRAAAKVDGPGTAVERPEEALEGGATHQPYPTIPESPYQIDN
jgi:hypothetical protein